MATSPLSLPVELLHDIVLYLDRDSLISLAQSCRVLHAVAVQQLHRSIPRLSGPDTIRCLHTLATTPDIAGKVRKFNIYSSFGVGLFPAALPPALVRPSGKEVWNKLLAVFRRSPPPLPPLAPPCLHFIARTERISLQTIANAFYNLKNLNTLIIHAPSHPKIWEFEHPIPTLQTIFVHRNAESPSLFVWIMTQRSITYLRMKHEFPLPFPISKGYSLPNLRCLTCSPLGVLHLFPGGRVSELNIEDLSEKQDMSVVDHLATVIASSSAKSGIQLQRLTVYGEKIAINHLLDRLGHLFPDLLSLRIFSVDMPREIEHIDFNHFLPKYTRLKTLEFFAEVPSPWYTSPPVEAIGRGVAGEEAKVKHWAELCPRLHEVRLPSHSKWCISRSSEGNKVEMEYPFSQTDNLKAVC